MASKKSGRTASRSVLPAQDISFFCLQISQLLSSGIPLSEGFDVLLEDASGPREKALLESMRDQLEDRVPLSRVLEESGLFPPYVIRMTEIGETTGQLDHLMLELSHFYDKEHEFRKALKNAVMYPMAMVIIMLTVLFLLATQVMPVFEGVFAQLGAEFTPLTRGVIRWVGIISGAGLCLTAVLLLGLLAAWIADRLRGSVFARLKQIFFRRSPIFIRQDISRYADIMALALHNGMDVDEGAEMALKLVENPVAAEKIRSSHEATENGTGYPDAVRAAGLFTAMQRRMIQVGERTGALDEAMARIASDCRNQTEEQISRTLSRLEPALTAALSAAAGGILILVMLPLIGILSSIG